MLILHSTSNKPDFNLAAEKYLFSRRQDEILFIYVNDPCVVIGCNQAILSEVNLDFCHENGIEVMRRMSGGGAVYHDNDNLNYCFIKNKIEGKYPISSDFLLPVITILGQMGIPVSLGKRKDLWLPDGYKISGTASHIGKDRALYHGTLLYNTNLENLQIALSSKSDVSNSVRATASVRSMVKNIRAFLEESGSMAPSTIDFTEIFLQEICTFYNLEKPVLFSPETSPEIEMIRQNDIQNPDWIYKK